MHPPIGYTVGVVTPGPTTRRHTERWAGNLLRSARAKKDVSQAQLAALAGVPRSTVERIEAGTRQPSLVTLSRLLAAVDLELRIRLDDYDDHDDVLDAHYAAMTAEQKAAADARHKHLLALVDAGRAQQA
jgi:transcriptional regulator with XRE-family HTH domain